MSPGAWGHVQEPVPGSLHSWEIVTARGEVCPLHVRPGRQRLAGARWDEAAVGPPSHRGAGRSCSGRSRPLPGRPGCSGRTWHMVHEEGDEPSNPALVSAFKSHGWSRGLRLGSGEDAVSQALDGRCGLPLVYVVSLYESGGRKSAPSGLTQPHAWAGKLEVPLSKEKSAHYSGWARARARPLGLSSHLPSPLAAVTQCVNCTTAHLWPGRHNFGGI